MSADPVLVVHPSKQALADASGARLLVAVVDALAAAPEAHLVLTGGSMGSAIIASLCALPGRDAVDWTRVHVWWGDERYLPAGDPDRNDTQNDSAGLSTLGLDPHKVHRVAGPDTSDSAEASAASYGEEIRASGTELFDVVMLGVGPDGHVASLFPHHPAQRVDGVAVAVHDSPKPPPDRVSMSFDCLEHTRDVWFLVAGPDKTDAVAAALTVGADRWDVPAAGVRGHAATLWLVDADAAATLG